MNKQNNPVYISLTSIFKNQYFLFQTLKSLISQTRKPDKIFLFLSEEPYILDSGFKNKKITDTNLLDFINKNPIINVKWVPNTGSYRKLLPILKDKWKEDCIIITVDDDTIYENNLVKNLLDDYKKYECVIGYRGFTPCLDKFEDFNYIKRKKLQNLSRYNFLTGKGGILYKPKFFHNTNNLIFNSQIYLNTCAKQDDIWFYILRVLNNVNCFTINKKWQVKDLTNGDGLYKHFNSKKNNNINAFKNTIKKIKECGI